MESEALKQQLALKESAVMEALALKGQLALKETAEQLALKESEALKEQPMEAEVAVPPPPSTSHPPQKRITAATCKWTARANRRSD
jgi:hypothetical protein